MRRSKHADGKPSWEAKQSWRNQKALLRFLHLSSYSLARWESHALLHTRSLRYGKLQNGCLVTVPQSLIPRLQQHFVLLSLGDTKVTVLWGMNGYLWIQRALPESSTNDQALFVEWQEGQHKAHAETEVLPSERQAIARLRNAIQCLSMVHAMITPEAVETVYRTSLDRNMRIGDMLRPDNGMALTASCRKNQ